MIDDSHGAQYISQAAEPEESAGVGRNLGLDAVSAIPEERIWPFSPTVLGPCKPDGPGPLH